MKQLVPALFTAGAIMALTGAAVFITGWIYAPYIYTVGAGCIALAQVNTPVKGKSKTPEPSCLPHEAMNGLPASQLLPSSNFTPLSVFHRKKKKKGYKKSPFIAFQS